MYVLFEFCFLFEAQKNDSGLVFFPHERQAHEQAEYARAVKSAVEKRPFGDADVFLDYYAAKSKSLLYSNGLFAPKDIFILFSLYQRR